MKVEITRNSVVYPVVQADAMGYALSLARVVRRHNAVGFTRVDDPRADGPGALSASEVLFKVGRPFFVRRGRTQSRTGIHVVHFSWYHVGPGTMVGPFTVKQKFRIPYRCGLSEAELRQVAGGSPWLAWARQDGTQDGEPSYHEAWVLSWADCEETFNVRFIPELLRDEPTASINDLELFVLDEADGLDGVPYGRHDRTIYQYTLERPDRWLRWTEPQWEGKEVFAVGLWDYDFTIRGEDETIKVARGAYLVRLVRAQTRMERR